MARNHHGPDEHLVRLILCETHPQGHQELCAIARAARQSECARHRSLGPGAGAHPHHSAPSRHTVRPSALCPAQGSMSQVVRQCICAFRLPDKVSCPPTNCALPGKRSQTQKDIACSVGKLNRQHTQQASMDLFPRLVDARANEVG